MSLILDALNRADQERSARQAVPTIQTVQQPVPPQRSFIAWERLAVMVPLLLVALYLVWEWAGPGTTAGRRTAAELSSAMAVPSTFAGLAAQPVTVDRAAALPMREPPRESAAVQRSSGLDADVRAITGMVPDAAERSTGLAGKGLGERQVDGGAGSPASPAHARASVTADEISSLYDVPGNQESAPSVHGALASQVLDEQIARATRAAASPAGEESIEHVPYITDLPLPLRRDIPTLNYSEHRPADQVGAARVRLNGRLLEEGQQVTSELTLVTIDELGIVMQFRGVTFRLPALNRWVNF